MLPRTLSADTAKGAPMCVVEVRSDRADFAKVLAAMQEWLDCNDRPSIRFETASEQVGTIMIKVGFRANDLAAQFCQQFHSSWNT